MRHRRKRSGILVPMLEDLMQSPVGIDDNEDINFLNILLRKMLARERERKTGQNVFSPSSLSACLRKVYLTRHAEILGIERMRSTKVQPNFYFLKGNWIHVQWQFALWKLERKVNDTSIFQLIDVEHRIMSKHGDHGGTVDALVSCHSEPLIVDFKGLNVRDFGNIARGGASGYELQLADYMVLKNSERKRVVQVGPISRALLVTENKGGPDSQHPIALHESVVELDEWLPNVRHRLGVLREFEADDRIEKIPPPECTSTTTFQFQGCPFRGYCKKEVKEIQEERKRLEGGDSEYRLARPPSRKRAKR